MKLIDFHISKTSQGVINAFSFSKPGISLGVLSPQGRHSATYTEHMPMKELHTAIQPACPGKFSYRPPRQSSGTPPTFGLTGYFVSWY